MARQRKRAYQDQTYWARPVPSTGDPRARLLIVGLAPGGHGSNRTGRMFTGDASGDFLTPAMYHAGFANQPLSVHGGDGLDLLDAYIVAVVHCAPPNNRPTAAEIANCRIYLLEHLRLLASVQVILALGKIAFDGVLAGLTEASVRIPSPRPKFSHGARYPIGSYTLLASYHPSRQNTQTGKLTRPMFDRVFERVKRILG